MLFFFFFFGGEEGYVSRASGRGTGSFHKTPEKVESGGKCLWRGALKCHCAVNPAGAAGGDLCSCKASL